MAEGDAPLGEIVGGQLHGDAVAGQDADAVSPQSAGQVRQNHAVMLQLHAEQAAGKLFQNNSGNFDIIFFTHSTFRFLTPCPARQTGCRGIGDPVCRAQVPLFGQAPIVTFAACRPLGPRVTSNSTLEPSSRLR